MADTGEDREIKQRVNAHQAEVARETNQLQQGNKRGRRHKDPRRDVPKRSPSTKAGLRSEADTATQSDS